MTTPARIKLLVLNRPIRMGERRLAEMIVAEGRIVKNKWGGLRVGEMRLTPAERAKVELALTQNNGALQ